MKRDGDLVAVDSVNLTVERGDVSGYLGPNGDGKTTSLRMLLGLIGPTPGTAHLFGRDPEGRSVSSRDRWARGTGSGSDLVKARSLAADARRRPHRLRAQGRGFHTADSRRRDSSTLEANVAAAAARQHVAGWHQRTLCGVSHALIGGVADA